MIYRLPRPLRQILALLILVVALAAVWLLAIAPVAGLIQRLGEEIATERANIVHLKHALEAAASRGEAAAAPEAELQSAFVTGDSAAIRLATLQAMLTSLFEANNVKPRSITAVPQRSQDGLALIGAEITLEAPLDVVQRIILALETQRPVLIIEQLDITAAVSDPSVPGAAANAASPLTVRFKITAAEAANKGDPQ